MRKCLRICVLAELLVNVADKGLSFTVGPGHSDVLIRGLPARPERSVDRCQLERQVRGLVAKTCNAAVIPGKARSFETTLAEGKTVVNETPGGLTRRRNNGFLWTCHRECGKVPVA